MSEPLTDAVASGDRRRALVALRNELARDIELVDPKQMAAVASLAKQLVDVLGLIDALPSGTESKRDELAKRREARRAGATVAKSADDGGDVGGAGGGRTRR